MRVGLPLFLSLSLSFSLFLSFPPPPLLLLHSSFSLPPLLTYSLPRWSYLFLSGAKLGFNPSSPTSAISINSPPSTFVHRARAFTIVRRSQSYLVRPSFLLSVILFHLVRPSFHRHSSFTEPPRLPELSPVVHRLAAPAAQCSSHLIRRSQSLLRLLQDPYTLNTLIGSLSRLPGGARFGFSILGLFFKVGYVGEGGALKLFDEMANRGSLPIVVTYGTVLKGLCKNGDSEMAFSLLNRMRGLSCEPDVVTFNSVMNRLCVYVRLGDAVKLFDVMSVRGFEPDWLSGLWRKKAIVFAVPEVVFSTCSQKHLSGFVEKADELKAKGGDVIACVSVNDALVMRAWKECLGIKIGDFLLICFFTCLLFRCCVVLAYCLVYVVLDLGRTCLVTLLVVCLVSVVFASMSVVLICFPFGF